MSNRIAHQLLSIPAIDAYRRPDEKHGFSALNSIQQVPSDTQIRKILDPLDSARMKLAEIDGAFEVAMSFKAVAKSSERGKP